MVEDRTRVLVVDDDEPLQRRLVRALCERGLDAVGAGSVADAIACAHDAPPAMAVIDLRLVDGSGLEVLEALRAVRPDLRAVMLTGYGSISSAVTALQRGAMDYLTKPADVEQILAALHARPEAETVDEADADGEVPTLERVEWEHIQRVLADCDGNISRAARALGLHRRTLQRKLAARPRER